MPDKDAAAPGGEKAEGKGGRTGEGPAPTPTISPDALQEVITRLENMDKTLKGQRSLHDRQIAQLRQELQRSPQSAEGYDYSEGGGQQGGADPTMMKIMEDNAKIRLAMQYPELGASGVDKIYNQLVGDPSLQASHRVIDPATGLVDPYRTMEDFYLKSEVLPQYGELRAKAAEASRETEEERERQKRQAMVSGSGAAEGESNVITRESVKQMTDEELTKAVKGMEDPGDPIKPF